MAQSKLFACVADAWAIGCKDREEFQEEDQLDDCHN